MAAKPPIGGTKQAMRERVTIEREVELQNAAEPLAPRERETTREFEIKPNGQKVTDSFNVPFRWVCRLQVEERTAIGVAWREQEPATGVLIGPRHVLTAAHLLDPYYQKVSTGLVQVKVRPGFDGSRHLGEEISTDLRVSKGWLAGKKDPMDKGAYDYGMVILPSDSISTKSRKELMGKPLGYWGHPTRGHKTVFAPLNAEFLESKTVHSAGYPKGMKRMMWVGSGTLSNVLLRRGDKVVKYKRGMDLSALAPLGEKAKGMSGGTIWHKVGSTRFLVGINASISEIQVGDQQTGAQSTEWLAHAARVTIELFEEVSEWMHAKP